MTWGGLNRSSEGPLDFLIRAGWYSNHAWFAATLRVCAWRQHSCQRGNGHNSGRRKSVPTHRDFVQLHKLLLKGVRKERRGVCLNFFRGIFYSHRRPARDSARQFICLVIQLARFRSLIPENFRHSAKAPRPRSRRKLRRHLPIRARCCSMNLAAKTSTARREKHRGETDEHCN